MGLTFLENQQAFAESEISRLKLRKAKFERRQERIEAGVVTLLQAQGRADRGTHDVPRPARVPAIA